MKLNTTEIKILRRIADGEKPRKSLSLSRLKLNGYVEEDGSLSVWGQQFLADYIAQTGDGPEDLKALLARAFKT
jgi:hypothetical protein